MKTDYVNLRNLRPATVGPDGRELTASIRRRDRAWREFCEKYEGRIAALAREHGISEAECDDVLQQVLMVVYRKSPGFLVDPDRGLFTAGGNGSQDVEIDMPPAGDGPTGRKWGRFRGWLGGVVRNLARKEWLRTNRRPIAISQILPNDSESEAGGDMWMTFRDPWGDQSTAREVYEERKLLQAKEKLASDLLRERQVEKLARRSRGKPEGRGGAISAVLRDLSIFAELAHCHPEDAPEIRDRLCAQHGLSRNLLGVAFLNVRRKVEEMCEVLDLVHEASARFLWKLEQEKDLVGGQDVRDAIHLIAGREEAGMALIAEARRTGTGTALNRFRGMMRVLCEITLEFGADRCVDPIFTPSLVAKKLELTEWLFLSALRRAEGAFTTAISKQPVTLKHVPSTP